MQKYILITLILLGFAKVQAQNASVESDIIGFQVGFIGADLYNEHKLSNTVALNSKLSLKGGFWTGTIYEKTGFVLFPAISVEPKWYYNLNRRVEKEKNINNNSGNYFSLQAEYMPKWFAISNYNNINTTNAISLVPTFGIRRNFSGNFNYEFKVGYGFFQSFGENSNTSSGFFLLDFKIGYDFFKR